MANEMLESNNHLTMFLILVLLVLSTRTNVEQQLSHLNTLLQATQQSVRIFRSGLETFHTSLVQPPS